MTIVYNCPAMYCKWMDKEPGSICPRHKVKVVAQIKENIPKKFWIEHGNYRSFKDRNLRDVI